MSEINYLRAMRVDDEPAPGLPISFIASTEGIKRDGLSVDQEKWLLEPYRANSVVLWVHDYHGERPPIGKANVNVTDGRLMADVTFDPDDEFAQQIERKYRSGYLNAVSVGWIDVPGAREEDGISHELLDISAVPVPGDPVALMERQRAGLRSLRRDIDAVLEEAARGAIPPHSTEKADEGAAWDAGGEVGKAEGKASLRRMHAWVSDDGDQDAKASYKLPHHEAEGKVVWRGVAAAMSRLLQAGTQIPDADRRGVYGHLSRHYEQFEKEPPEFRTAEEVAILGSDGARGLFLEGEPGLVPDEFGGPMEHLERGMDLLLAAIEKMQSALEGKPEPETSGERYQQLKRIQETLEEAGR